MFSKIYAFQYKTSAAKSAQKKNTFSELFFMLCELELLSWLMELLYSRDTMDIENEER